MKMNWKLRGPRFATATICLLLVTFAKTASGQALTPEQGEGSFTTAYNYIAFNGHFDADGSRVTDAASRAQNVLFEFEYGITDKLAVNVSVPIVSTRYASTSPPPEVLRGLFDQTRQALGPEFYGHDFLDDGNYHTTVTDFALSARYNVALRPLIVTPFIALGVPSHNYAYVGESAPGRNLREVQFGTFLGRRLDPFLRKGYVQSLLAFAIPEEALGERTYRMNISLEFDYLLSRRLAVRGFTNWQHSFEGIGSLEDLTTPELALTHDRLLKASYWHLGGGLAYSVTPKTSINADVVTFLAGSVTHYGTGVSVGITRNFTLRPHKQ
jgi:hypothetical protein